MSDVVLKRHCKLLSFFTIINVKCVNIVILIDILCDIVVYINSTDRVMMCRYEMRQLIEFGLFALLLFVVVFDLNQHSKEISECPVHADDSIRSVKEERDKVLRHDSLRLVKEERDNVSLQLNRLQVQ